MRWALVGVPMSVGPEILSEFQIQVESPIFGFSSESFCYHFLRVFDFLPFNFIDFMGILVMSLVILTD
jgi:hypothetical protein